MYFAEIFKMTKFTYKCIYVVVVQSLSCVQLFVTPWIAAHQASLSFTDSWSLFKLMFTESVMPSSATPFSSCPQSFPASGSFPISWLFASGVQNIGTSASVSLLPMNIPSWFPLGLTSLISLQSKILSRVFESNSYSALSLLYGPTLTSVHDCWKNHSCDYTDLCQQSDVSAF